MFDFNNPMKFIFNNSYGFLFGDPQSARAKIPDSMNYYMFTTLFRDYIQWHEKNHHFHENYDNEKRYLNVLGYFRYFWMSSGILFAGMILNPNYTKPKSFYFRKFNVVFCAWIGYCFGNKNYLNYEHSLYLRMNDYFPMEVKRALRTEDYRYLALFDYKNPGRQLFDTQTGKSLS
ncbi:unnamed protein product [Moneuplotes crassus]|uniref:Uncharacterized protein n=1 Tax=Euplotes crassus TaxID=5936 RepID=A0AAD2D5T8_EUPCR|nr:unnamed protein product [Moneuplotes crassus]